MAAQGEQGQEGIDLDIESMAQDNTVMQVELSPQPDSEPEGSTGVAAFDTPPPPSVKFPPRSPVKPRRIGPV